MIDANIDIIWFIDMYLIFIHILILIESNLRYDILIEYIFTLISTIIIRYSWNISATEVN